MICQHCNKQIILGQRRHHSRQPGMKGNYHWGCFVIAVREANKRGEQEVKTSIAVSGLSESAFNSGVKP